METWWSCESLKVWLDKTGVPLLVSVTLRIWRWGRRRQVFFCYSVRWYVSKRKVEGRCSANVCYSVNLSRNGMRRQVLFCYMVHLSKKGSKGSSSETVTLWISQRGVGGDRCSANVCYSVNLSRNGMRRQVFFCYSVKWYISQRKVGKQEFWDCYIVNLSKRSRRRQVLYQCLLVCKSVKEWHEKTGVLLLLC